MTKKLVRSLTKDLKSKWEEKNRLEKLHAAISSGITNMHPDQLEEFTALFVETLPRQELITD